MIRLHNLLLYTGDRGPVRGVAAGAAGPAADSGAGNLPTTFTTVSPSPYYIQLIDRCLFKYGFHLAFSRKTILKHYLSNTFHLATKVVAVYYATYA